MSAPMKSMNLKQLAEHLSLSQATVSRALNGYPEIKEATRNRVLTAAAEFGYRANSIARSLATGRSGNIGYRDGCYRDDSAGGSGGAGNRDGGP